MPNLINHLPHLEDLIILEGAEGLKKVSRVIHELSIGYYSNFSLKWDGAPAVFVGIDPNTDTKFVAKKSIFNVKPVIYHSDEEIDAHINNERLRSKMKTCLKYLPAPADGVVQGDLMFTEEDLVETIAPDGKAALAFHPNTIRYIVSGGQSFLRIARAKLGWVPHTAYSIDAALALTPSRMPYLPTKAEVVAFTSRFNIQFGPLFREDIAQFGELPENTGHTTASMNSYYRDGTPTAIVDSFSHLYALITSRKDAMLMSILPRVAAQQNVIPTLLMQNGVERKTDHEGLVYNNGEFACKLVNRTEFSFANFSKDVVKGWN